MGSIGVPILTAYARAHLTVLRRGCGGVARRATKAGYQVKPEPMRQEVIAGPKSYHAISYRRPGRNRFWRRQFVVELIQAPAKSQTIAVLSSLCRFDGLVDLVLNGYAVASAIRSCHGLQA
jgi:hypothetical protein